MDLNNHIVNLTRDIAERETARRLLVEIMEAVRGLPQEQRLDRATTILHSKLLTEMCDYKDRLNAQAKKLLAELQALPEKKRDMRDKDIPF